MEALLFSQASLSRLVRIRRRLEEEFGFEYRLADRHQILELLTAASASPDRAIRRDFHEFLDTLDSRQRTRLQNLGIPVPEMETETEN